jgi:hypothetical protein
MLDETIQKSRSADPEQRRQAISALANSKDPAALAPLAILYRTDPDPTLRELALKAGRYIRQHATTAPVPSTLADSSGLAPLAEAESKVSARDQELAKGYLDTATSHMTQGEKTRAVENLGKALALNPALVKESFVYNLIMTLTGMRPAEALPILTHPDRRGELILKMGGKQKTKHLPEHIKNPEKMTWENVLADFGIYFLVTTISLWIVLIASISLIEEMLNSMPALMATENLDAVLTASVVALGIMSLFVGISSVISLAIQGVAIHAAAIYILGGNGTLIYLFRRLVPFESIATVAFSAGFVALSLFGSSAEVWALVTLASVVGTFAIGYYLANLVGDVYNFGSGSGCGAIVLGSVLVAAISWFGNYLMVGLLGKLL